MKFQWIYLIVAIIVFAALASTVKIGKWLFVIVMLGIILAFGDKILPNKLT